MAIEKVNFTIPRNNDLYGSEEGKENNVLTNDRNHKVIDPNVIGGIYERMYEHAKLQLEESATEIEELKNRLEETTTLLNEERGRSRHLRAVNKCLERDIDTMEFDQEKVIKEAQLSQHLLSSRDKEIESLVAQINLLVQIGTIKDKRQKPQRRLAIPSFSNAV
eukprot:CAMPEP_0194203064 /NCGR_PEP_ID=MMETSP0156-20130528/2950_1 /TAXON_ID=33649 /ORGANISM="Thalassionema nitzschioides, Strain L26-B" /LENGTH=163 /DNA_ID=CAMNT_0038928737 /DNA_START=172 /DNA_END=663 /DNA_ORIENTATION=-